MSKIILKDYIRSIMDFNDSQIDQICSSFTVLAVRKGEYLLRQGNTCNFEGFVTKGCFRIFTIDVKGNDNILYFAEKNWWLLDHDSFINQTPSNLNFQALEDSEVLMISKKDKELLYDKYPFVEKLFRIMLQKAVAAWQQRVVRNHTMTAEERYHHFITSYPTIASRVTNKQIASYLGITQEFVSMIRHRRSSKKT